jgi:ubiquinone/menaquinone biosynthesis C-methylase UbiE
LQHDIALLIHHGKLNVAPVNSPARVLDVGTGTGIWAIEFGEPFLLCGNTVSEY